MGDGVARTQRNVTYKVIYDTPTVNYNLPVVSLLVKRSIGFAVSVYITYLCI